MKSYSQDLRNKVVNYIQKGNSNRSAALRFQVSPSAVNRWMERFRETGNYQARVRKSHPKKIDLIKLQEQIERLGYVDTEVLTAYFKSSKTALYKRLKQLGYTFKKKATPTWRLPSKNKPLSKTN